MTLTTKAYAKINLYLDVIGKRDDGYHNIESVMQAISLADEVTVTKNQPQSGEQRIEITCTDENIPTDRRNIAWKCAEKFFEAYGIGEYSVSIHIEKHIPVCGGLAGGSTDGAAVLKLLNELYVTHATVDELCRIGGRVGADVPFCIVGGCALCTDTGVVVEPIAIPKQDYHIVIGFSGGGVSTPEAYGRIDAAGLKRPFGSDKVIAQVQSGKLPTAMYNAFETVILPSYPSAVEIKNTLMERGADSAMMSGSGPTVFGVFESESATRHAVEVLSSGGVYAVMCSPV